jgi:putative transposase
MHFITFCCFQRRKLLASLDVAESFEHALERIRRDYWLRVYGYVVMPEHVHLLVSEPERQTLAVAIKSLKQGVARRNIGAAEHFWQKRYYDLNVRDHKQFIEKVRYIHRNPVRAGLCSAPEDWPFSSFSHYSTGAKGSVEIESDWTAMRRSGREPQLLKVRE